MMRIKAIFLAVLMAGISPAYADIVLPFNGQVDFSKKEVNFNMDFGTNGDIVGKASRLSETQYNLLLNINHWKTSAFDFSSQVETSLQLIESPQDGQRNYYGKITSQFSLLDYQPIDGLQGEFSINNNRLTVDSLSFANLGFKGYVELQYPHKLDMAMKLKDFNLANIIAFVSEENKDNSSGEVSGQIKLSGVLDRLEVKADLESIDGAVDDWKFDNFRLNFDGVYPVMQIANSSVYQTDGLSFKFDGTFDLNDPATFKKQINNLSFQPIVDEKKGQTEWTIKRLKEDGLGTTELKYFMKTGEKTNSAEQGSDMLGVQKKVAF